MTNLKPQKGITKQRHRDYTKKIYFFLLEYQTDRKKQGFYLKHKAKTSCQTKEKPI
jgi:hypothetical protein